MNDAQSIDNQEDAGIILRRTLDQEKAEGKRAAGKYLCKQIDDHLIAGDYQWCETLFTLEIDEVRSALLLAILTVTFAYQDNLPSRASFVEKVRGELARRGGAEKADRLLKGLNDPWCQAGKG